MITRRAIRFGLTGILNTVVHAVTASLWIHAVHPNPGVANGVAFTVATLFSFTINTLWSFSQPLEKVVFFRFFVVALLGLPLSAGIATVVDWLGYSYVYGIAAVVCLLPPVNFVLHNFWTYRVAYNDTPIHQQKNKL